MAQMDKKTLLAICKANDLYRTPGLNDKLYLNFKGFTRIENLEEYTGLKALFLEGNALDSIEGLPTLPELKCLHMQQNSLWAISHLEGCPELDTLNVCHNQLKRLDGLACCSKLQTLLATHNQLESLESVAHLAECPSLVTLDLQNNNISDPAVLELLKGMPNLRCLYLKGNPVVSAIKNYRKTLIAAIPTLGYLDDRPVFEDERRLVDAWAKGGLEAERAERTAIKEEKEAYDRRNFEAMQTMRKEGWRKRREALGLLPGDADPALEGMDEEEYQFLEDPPELVEARKRLAAYTAREGEEESPDLASARQGLAQAGETVSLGTWNSKAENDGEIYLASVKAKAALAGQGGGGEEEDEEDDARPAKDKSPSKGGAPPEAAKQAVPVADASLDEMD